MLRVSIRVWHAQGPRNLEVNHESLDPFFGARRLELGLGRFKSNRQSRIDRKHPVFADDDGAVHDDGLHAGSGLSCLFVGRFIRHGRRIEHHDIGDHGRLDTSHSCIFFTKYVITTSRLTGPGASRIRLFPDAVCSSCTYSSRRPRKPAQSAAWLPVRNGWAAPGSYSRPCHL